VAEVPLEFAVFTHEPFAYQRIGTEAWRMRSLGMTLQVIGGALGVDEKTVRNVLRMGATRSVTGTRKPIKGFSSSGVND
jgi:hypothetical protein